MVADLMDSSSMRLVFWRWRTRDNSLCRFHLLAGQSSWGTRAGSWCPHYVADIRGYIDSVLVGREYGLNSLLFTGSSNMFPPSFGPPTRGPRD